MSLKTRILLPMNANRGISPLGFDARQANQAWTFAVDCDSATVQVSIVPGSQDPGAGTAATYSVKLSVDGVTYFDPPGGAVTVNSNSASTAIDTTGATWLRVSVATASTKASERASVVVSGYYT